MNCKIWMDW